MENCFYINEMFEEVRRINDLFTQCILLRDLIFDATFQRHD